MTRAHWPYGPGPRPKGPGGPCAWARATGPGGGIAAGAARSGRESGCKIVIVSKFNEFGCCLFNFLVKSVNNC